MEKTQREFRGKKNRTPKQGAKKEYQKKILNTALGFGKRGENHATETENQAAEISSSRKVEAEKGGGLRLGNINVEGCWSSRRFHMTRKRSISRTLKTRTIIRTSTHPLAG